MSIYVITDNIKSNKNMYKIGRTSKSKKGILSTYTRHLGNPVLKFYQEVPYNYNYKDVERTILQELKTYRIKNSNGNLSEWKYLLEQEKTKQKELKLKKIELYTKLKKLNI